MKKLLALLALPLLLTGCFDPEPVYFSYRAEIIEVGTCVSRDWREKCAVKLGGLDGKDFVFVGNTDVAPMKGMVVYRSCSFREKLKVRCTSNWMDKPYLTYENTYAEAMEILDVDFIEPTYGI